MSCHCGNKATSACGGCSRGYCGRECQIAHWPAHKAACQEHRALAKFRAAWISEAVNRIGGNIDAVSARWPGCDINVRIDETIAEFTAGSSLHFAHISADKRISAPDAFTALAPANHITVRVQLTDFASTAKMEPAPSALIPPDDVWSVTFDM